MFMLTALGRAPFTFTGGTSRRPWKGKYKQGSLNDPIGEEMQGL